MDEKTWLAMDPGSKKFACTFIRRGFPIWMGYHPMVPSFQINDLFWFDIFQKASLLMVRRCDALVIERFFNRQANARVSPEKLNLMIGNLITIARLSSRPVIARTASTWKRKYDYDYCIDEAVDIGYLKKDKHFVDTILMWAESQGLENDYYRFLRRGMRPYKAFRKVEAWNKYLSKLPAAERDKAITQFKRIRKLRTILASKGHMDEKKLH